MEVITYGGGEFVRDVFNGVAALVGVGAFGSALRLSLLLGLLFTLFQTAFNMNVWVMIRWFMTTLIIYLCLMVPKVDVTVTDRFDPGLPSPTVANVPIGLALVASITTTVGDRFTDLTETAFSLPIDLEYQENGFIFGSKIFRDSMSFRVTDTTFSGNLSGYIRNCVFFDLLEHRYSVTDLRETNDLWTFITTTHAPNPARFYEFVTGPGATTVQSCDLAATTLDGQWAAEIDRVATIYGKQIRPDLSDAAARALVLGALVDSHDFFLGTARAATAQIQQTTLGNLIDKAVRDEGAELGADALLDAYGQARTDVETANAIAEGARLADRFVPLFRTVAETVFYGLFPVLFPIFLLPMAGIRLLRGYIFGFVALMSWGPLYVLLHRISMGTAEIKSLGASFTPTSGNEITLVTQSGIAGAHADIAMIAGYLTLLIPFAAARLGQGAMAFGGLAQSFLQPAQSAAQAAARDMTTGNFSFGNTSFGTHRFNMTDGNRASTSSFSDVGESSFNTPQGGRVRIAGGGRTIIDGSGAGSRTFTDVLSSQQFSQAMTFEAGRSEEMRVAAAEREQQARSALSHQMSEAAFQMSNGASVEEATGWGINTNQAKAFNTLVTDASRFASRYTDANERALATEAYISASAQYKWGLPGGIGPSAKVEGGVKGSAVSTNRQAEIAEEAREASRSSSASTNYDFLVATFDRDSTGATSGKTSTWREGFAANLQSLHSASSDVERYQARADTARELASSINQEGSSISQQLSQPFWEYMVDQVGLGRAQTLALSSEPQELIEVRRMANDFVNHWTDDALAPMSVAGWKDPRGVEIATPRGANQIGATASHAHDRAVEFASAPPEGFDAASFDQSKADRIHRASEGVEDFAEKITFRGSDAVEHRAQAQAEAVEETTPDKVSSIGGALSRRPRLYTGGDPTFDFEFENAEQRGRDEHYSTGENRLRDN
ncbi:MAG: conjugal transfer protein TraG N-terminal domain-containing protein [Pseudomonadota bacterium]